MSEISPTYCVLPWTHYFVSTKGHHYPCCISSNLNLPNLDELGKKFKIENEESMMKSWNSKYMKDIRTQMLSGGRPAPCQQCYKLEDLGVASHREFSNRRFQQHIPEVLKKTQSDGSLAPDLRSLDIRLGNMCNLKCRMCSPISSLSLLADWKRLYPGLTQQITDEFLGIDWYTKPEFWAVFVKHAENIEILHFAGGEPFLIPEHFDFLSRLVDLKFSKKITLTYNTNMTVLPEKLLALWKQFKSIEICVSLDGTEKVNNYIRYPSNWQQIQKNIKRVHDSMEELHVIQLSFNITVQVYNIYDLPSLVEFLRLEYPKSNFLLLSLLFQPSFLSIQILPLQMKKQLTQIWTSFIFRLCNRSEKSLFERAQLVEFIKNAKAVIKFMNESDQSRLIPHFLRRTKIIDESRNQNIFEFLPELLELNSKEHKFSFLSELIESQALKNESQI